MSVQRSLLPDPLRPDARYAFASTWRVGSPERQRATVEAITKTWESLPWPHEGLLSYSVYTGTDGDTLLHYSQWRDQAAYEEMFHAPVNGRSDRNALIDAAVPGIERVALFKYELYRSSSLNERASEPREPGAIVIVDVEFEGPDRARQQDWVDGVFAALASDEQTHPGGISGHFHVSLDGTRVLNYAEWESVRAHEEALAAPGDGVGSDTEEWRRVQQYPGVVGGSVRRYLPAVSFSAG